MKIKSECQRNNTIMHAQSEKEDMKMYKCENQIDRSVYPLYIYHIYVKRQMRHFPSIRLQMSNKTRVYYVYQNAAINIQKF